MKNANDQNFRRFFWLRKGLYRSAFIQSVYYRNFSGNSLEQVETVDVGNVAKWRENLI